VTFVSSNYLKVSMISNHHRKGVLLLFFIRSVVMIRPNTGLKCDAAVIHPVYLLTTLHHGDIRRGSSWRCRQMRVGWSTTAIFGDLAGDVFENFGDTASNTICSPLSACSSLKSE